MAVGTSRDAVAGASDKTAEPVPEAERLQEQVAAASDRPVGTGQTALRDRTDSARRELPCRSANPFFGERGKT